MRVLFVTASQERAYTDFQQQFAFESGGIVPDLRVASLLLRQSDDGSPAPDAVLIGHDIPVPQAVQFIRTAKAQTRLRDVRWVVVVNQTADFLAESLSGLATTITYQELTGAALAGAIGLRQLKAQNTVFFSAMNIKGGTGKTTFLSNLAESLSRRNLRVALVDADVADGDVAQALGVPRVAGTIDKLARELSQPDSRPTTLVGRYLYRRSDNLHVIPAPGRSDYMQDYLNEITAQAIIDTLMAYRYDAALVDLPGLVRATPFTRILSALPTSHFFLIYHHDHPFERDGFTRALQVLRGLKAQDRAAIVILGSADKNHITRPEQSDLEQTTHLHVKAYLPYDPLVRQAQAEGVSVYELTQSKGGRGLNFWNNPKSPYARGVETLTDIIMREAFS